MNRTEAVEKQAKKIMKSDLFKRLPISYGLKRRLAFSLAEVLLTLMVVGVVAAMTIHAIINKIDEVTFKSQYKKVYSTLSNAVNSANQDQNQIASITIDVDGTTIKSNTTTLFSYLNISKTCTAAELCWTQNTVLGLNGTNINSYDWVVNGAKTFGARILADGTVFSEYVKNAYSGVYMGVHLLVDLNGRKGPNRLGRDIHFFVVQDTTTTEPKLIPYFDFGQTFCTDYDVSVINAGCAGLNVSGEENRGYTCGAKWIAGQ